MKQNDKYDVAIIGGGINGVGIAAVASYHGLKVFLCEQHDLASGTSCASSKLIHGGLRYLEYYDFALVRESLHEREILLKRAKHLVHPKQFIIPFDPAIRPWLLVKMGLFLYDHLYWHSSLPKSRSLKIEQNPSLHFLKANYHDAFEYSDCVTDDARLVIANALAAKHFGSTITTYCKCNSAIQRNNEWHLEMVPADGNSFSIRSKVLINATGPWAEKFLRHNNIQSKHRLSLVKGSHIVLPRLYEGDFAVLIQNQDKRVIFVIPYLEKYSLVGTTDVFYDNDPSTATITDSEITYLLNSLSDYFCKHISVDAIIHHFSGVRPLLHKNNGDPAAITREYRVEEHPGSPPLLSIFGGKITTYRALAAKTMEKLAGYFSLKNSKAYLEALPGSNFEGDLTTYLANLHSRYPFLPTNLLSRYLRTYGCITEELLGSARTMSDLGLNFGNDLYQREVDYLVTNEWATTPEDILWRRTKLGYEFSKENHLLLQRYLKNLKK